MKRIQKLLLGSMALAIALSLPAQAVQPAPQTRMEKVKTWAKIYGAPTALLATGVGIMLGSIIYSVVISLQGRSQVKSVLGVPTVLQGVRNAVITNPSIQHDISHEMEVSERSRQDATDFKITHSYGHQKWGYLAGNDNRIRDNFANAYAIEGETESKLTFIMPSGDNKFINLMSLGVVTALGGGIWLAATIDKQKKLTEKIVKG